MGSRSALALALVAVLAFTLGRACGTKGSDPDAWATELVPASAAARAGAKLFTSQCAECHGSDGDGNGPKAATLDPKPRDFSEAVFKFRSTRGQPTREDLVAVITRGVPGTAMEPFAQLAAAECLALAEHVRLLAMRGRLRSLLRIRSSSGEALTRESATEDAEQVLREFEVQALPCPPPPADEAASASLGRALFVTETARCAACHGPEGRGDGPQAPLLSDRSGNRTPPRDLRRGTRDARDLFYRIRCGVGGTAMPSFDGALTEEQIWNLAHFVRSLGIPASAPVHDR